MQLNDGQKVVLRAIGRLGDVDDVTLAAYCHHLAEMSSSGVRTRRSELARKGLVQGTGVVRTRSGRSAAEHGLTGLGRQEYRRLTRVRRARKPVAV